MAKKDIGEMTRAAGFQNQFWLEFVAAVADLSGSADQLYAVSNDQLREAARAAAQSIVQVSATKTIDDLVAAVKDAKNPHQLTYVNSEITEANFPVRPPRSNPTTVTLRELGLTRWNAHKKVIATLDQKHTRPTMAEVLSYALNGWDGETDVWFILENGRVGSFDRLGAYRGLSLYDVGIDDDWLGDYRFLVFLKKHLGSW